MSYDLLLMDLWEHKTASNLLRISDEEAKLMGELDGEERNGELMKRQRICCCLISDFIYEKGESSGYF